MHLKSTCAKGLLFENGEIFKRSIFLQNGDEVLPKIMPELYEDILQRYEKDLNYGDERWKSTYVKVAILDLSLRKFSVHLVGCTIFRREIFMQNLNTKFPKIMP